MHKHEKPHFLCIVYFLFLSLLHLCFFLFLKFFLLEIIFFQIFYKNNHDTTRVHVQNSQIRLPLAPPKNRYPYLMMPRLKGTCQPLKYPQSSWSAWSARNTTSPSRMSPSSAPAPSPPPAAAVAAAAAAAVLAAVAAARPRRAATRPCTGPCGRCATTRPRPRCTSTARSSASAWPPRLIWIFLLEGKHA